VRGLFWGHNVLAGMQSFAAHLLRCAVPVTAGAKFSLFVDLAFPFKGFYTRTRFHKSVIET